jgi:hypothetical protein
MQSFLFLALQQEAKPAQPSFSDVSYQQQDQLLLLLALARQTHNQSLGQFHPPVTEQTNPASKH